MIAIGCDHAGIDLKPHVIEVLEELGLPYQDFGTNGHDRVDYPVYGARAAQAVAAGQCEKGIVLCGTGVGISMAAGKVPGIRCVCCSDCYSASMSRKHNDANMIALGARVVGSELAKMILRIWLTTDFEGERHGCRVEQIRRLEQGEALE
ncbi:MAG: ribose 5-phosphate isomerase B [Candidatus Limiplasma sp.]|nr:ribose 5-phosphate isomerase B [Candidatus Limiplasma sp.]